MLAEMRAHTQVLIPLDRSKDWLSGRACRKKGQNDGQGPAKLNERAFH
jgi:hypothetical protein